MMTNYPCLACGDPQAAILVAGNEELVKDAATPTPMMWKLMQAFRAAVPVGPGLNQWT